MGESEVSGKSDVLHIRISQVLVTKRKYINLRFYSFLQDTKNAKGVKLEEYFPDISAFYVSARIYANNRLESGITDQEMYRLRKLVPKARRQMNSNDRRNFVS